MDSENSSCSFDKVEKVLLYCLAGKHIKSSWHSFEMNMFFSSNTPRILFLEFLDDKKNHPDRQRFVREFRISEKNSKTSQICIQLLSFVNLLIVKE